MTPQARRAAAAALVAFVVGVTAAATSEDPELAISAGDAADAAAADARVAPLLAGGWTRYRAGPLFDDEIRVSFFDGSRIVAEAAVREAGEVTRVSDYRAGNRIGTPVMRAGIVLAGATLLFALALLTRPVLSWHNLDVAALALAAATVGIANARYLETALGIWFAVVFYLGVRSLARALRDEPGGDPLVVVPPRMLAWVALAAGGAVAVVSLTSTNITDVAYASLEGATSILNGQLPYGQPTEVVHGDTYPLLAYLLFVPGALLSPVRDTFDDPGGALVVACVLLLASAWALKAVVARHAGPSAGHRAAVAILVYPPAVAAASGGTNDLAVTALLAAALSLAVRPASAAAAVAAAAAVKVGPLIAVPAWIVRGGARDRARSIAAGAGLAGVLLALLVALGGPAALGEMIDAIAFQAERRSLRSPWTLFGLEWLQPAFVGVVAAVAVGAAVAAWHAPMDLRRLAALTAGLLLLLQLAGNYWAVTYVVWALPLLVFVLVTPGGRMRGA